MTRQSVREHKIKKGEAFRVNVTKTVPAGGTLTCHIENPSNSGKAIVITGAKSGMVGPFTNKRIVGADITAGTSVSAENILIGDDNTTVTATYKGSTWANADNVQTEYYGKDDSAPGDNDNSFGSGCVSSIGSLLDGNDFILELENRSSSTSYDAFITIEYYESNDI